MRLFRKKPRQTSPARRFSDDQIAKILKFGVSYAASLPLMPTIGTASEVAKSRTEIESKWIDGFYKRQSINEAELLAAAEKDTFPIPHPDNREGYEAGLDFLYWLSGYDDYLELTKIAAKYGVHGGRFFDFGGATGRLFRHFIVQSNLWDVWSCDFKQSSVDYNLANYPKSAKLFLNNSYPSLPIDDKYFDLIAGMSVFTHINETETSWLLELRRILKVGGIACLTIHNDRAWATPHQSIKDQIKQYRPDLLGKETLPRGKTVISWRDDDPYNCNVFHSNDYIEENWGRYFEVLSIGTLYPGWSGTQELVVLRRTD